MHRREQITYKGLARQLLGGRILRREERVLAEEILTLGDSFEEALRLAALLERIADRDGLIRLPGTPERPNVRRYLDPGSNDRWAIEAPGPSGAVASPAPEVREGTARPPAAATRPAEEKAADRSPAPDEARPEPSPRLVQSVEEITPVPGVTQRFQDEATGEPLRTLFGTFAPCRTPEDLGKGLLPVREQVLARTSATSFRCYLLDPNSDDLRPLPVRGHHDIAPASLAGRVKDRVLGAGRTLHVSDLRAPDAMSDGDTGALCVFPLVSGEETVGTLELRRDTPGPFDAEELQFFALAALTTGGAIGRAEVLEKLIYLDKLTGLYNRAYFDDQIEREIERANRSNTSVALMMADLDHFKRINDTFGHQAGDQALAHVASLFRANIRQIDIAARYGGEEFAILLPGTTRARAERTAERLRKVVAASPVGDVIPALKQAHLSLSVGVALYPDDAGSSQQLIDRADRVALYSAKNSGRNRVVTYAKARGSEEGLRPGA